VVGIFCWNKVKDTRYKWFVIYLGYILLADLSGALIKMQNIPNEHYYDLFVIPVEFIFFLWLFNKSLEARKHRRLTAVFGMLYTASVLIDNFYFSHHPFHFCSFSYSIGNLLLLASALLFFIQLTNSDKVLQYSRNTMFWISAGVLIYYLGSFPYYALKNTFAHLHKHANVTYYYIALTLDCIMYTMFSIALIWGNSKSS